MHHEVAHDGSFPTGLVIPRQLHTAMAQMSLRRGVHSESLLPALASNITWTEHHWIRLGSDPSPAVYNVIAEYVGPQAYAAGADSKQRWATVPPVVPIAMDAPVSPFQLGTTKRRKRSSSQAPAWQA